LRMEREAHGIVNQYGAFSNVYESGQINVGYLGFDVPEDLDFPEIRSRVVSLEWDIQNL